MTGIGGRNGAGKTTLLRIATAILTPDAGTVTVDGLSSDSSWREYHRRIGFLSAGDRGLYNRFSVRGHLEYGARIAFVPRARRREAVDEALVRFGLTDLATRRADRLSQGQRQRLRLALTVVHDPKVLLLDEPRNSLDDEGLAMLTSAIDDVLAPPGCGDLVLARRRGPARRLRPELRHRRGDPEARLTWVPSRHTPEPCWPR